MKIYTRTGDSGTTGLFGGPRVSKSSLRIEAYGTVDELNALLGLARSGSTLKSDDLEGTLSRIQDELFVLGADLATPLEAGVDVPRMTEDHSLVLEREIDRFESDLEPLKSFILPGGTERASRLHLARTVCRRAERIVVKLSDEDKTHPETVRYLNRLSDFLFVAARWANHSAGKNDVKWTSS
jgi:cob(I)alamin adenosyltransferase